MDSETLEKLLAADNADSGQWPKAFDLAKAEVRVAQLQIELEKLLGQSLHLAYEQDSTYVFELALLKKGEKENHFYAVFGVLFSAWGNLFTVCNCHAEKLSSNFVDEVILLTQDRGFVYVNLDELQETYTGSHANFKLPQGVSTRSWADRFFGDF